MLTRRAILIERLQHLEAACDALKQDVTYWRERYEKLADSVLFRDGLIVAPIHTTPQKPLEAPGDRVMRVASLVGRDLKRPINVKHPADPREAS